MDKLQELLVRRNLKLTQAEVDGVKKRLVFAGLSPNLEGEDIAIASDLVDKLVDKMRFSKQNISDYAELSSTRPKVDQMEAASDGKTVMVALVDGRICRYNTDNNVVMPLRKTS